MIHKNDMSHWTDIRCAAGHESHDSRVVSVELGRATHGYRDEPMFPARLATTFDMHVWRHERYADVPDGVYCPARDVVSETIESHRIWEPTSTAMVAMVLASDQGHGKTVIDMGAQIGWFTMLAAAWGYAVAAYDADADCLDLIDRSAEANGWTHLVDTIQERVGPDSFAHTPGEPVRLAKIDVEGSEDQAVRVLRPQIDLGLIDHMLIEVSPVFAPYYPDLVCELIDAGYEAYMVPAKAYPPWSLDDLARDMVRWRVDRQPRDRLRDEIASLHQENMWFRREGASW